jgi:hypothetical protein
MTELTINPIITPVEREMSTKIEASRYFEDVLIKHPLTDRQGEVNRGVGQPRSEEGTIRSIKYFRGRVGKNRLRGLHFSNEESV